MTNGQVYFLKRQRQVNGAGTNAGVESLSAEGKTFSVVRPGFCEAEMATLEICKAAKPSGS